MPIKPTTAFPHFRKAEFDNLSATDLNTIVAAVGNENYVIAIFGDARRLIEFTKWTPVRPDL